MTAPNGPILFNSSTGSDTQASGLGPATAVFGAGASTTAASAVVTGIDTTGVTAGDLLWVQSTSGRQFSIIASVDSASQVTCDDTFANTESSRNWGIGGKRASITGSLRLFDDGSSADSKAGWIMELQSGYTETISASRLSLRGAGDTTSGPKILRGVSGAATMPVISFSHSTADIVPWDAYWQIQDLELKKITAAGGSVFSSAGMFFHVRGVVVSSDGNDWGSICGSVQHSWSFEGCQFSGCSDGIDAGGGSWVQISVYDCTFTSLGGTAVKCNGANKAAMNVRGCVFDSCNIGVEFSSSRTDGIANGSSIEGNIFYGSTSDAIKLPSTTPAFYGGLSLSKNIIYGNGGYGVNFSGAGVDKEFLDAVSMTFSRNAFGSNTSGNVNVSNVSRNEVTLTADPFTDAANGDFSLNDVAGGGAALKAATLTIGSTTKRPFRQWDNSAGGGGGGSTLIVIDD